MWLLACQHTGQSPALCLWPFCAFQSELHSILAQLTPLHSLIWELGQPGLGRILDTETRGWPGGLGYDLTGTSVELLAFAQAVLQKQYRPLMAVPPLEPL